MDFLKKFLIYLLCGALLAGGGFFIGVKLGSSGTRKEPVSQGTAKKDTVTEAPETTEASEETQPEESEETTAADENPGVYTLSFVGNMTLGCDGFIINTPYAFPTVVGEDPGYPMQNVADILTKDDLTLGNLECALTSQDYSTKNGSSLYKGDPGYAKMLQLGGIEAVSLANNHSLDYGEEGLTQTEEALAAQGIGSVRKDQTLVLTTDRGLKVGIYAVTSQAAQADIEAAVSALKEAGAQVIVAITHWGSEDTYVVNPDQKKLGRKLIDGGVNIVCGTGPHHVQKVESYHGGAIYYSLGTFCSGANDHPSDMDAVIIQQELTLGEDGIVTLGTRRGIPVCMSSSTPQNVYQPTPYPEDSKAYERVGKKLFDDYTFGRNAQEYPF